jgi:hypothetical protein
MPKDILDMNGNELRALRDSLPDDHDPRELRMLSDRITAVSINEGVSEGLALAKKVSVAEKLDQAAYDKWSGLKDKDSEFAKAVDAELEARGDADTNERALMDAATSVAMDMGMVPDAWKPHDSAMAQIKGAGSRNSLGDGGKQDGMSDTQRDLMSSLAKRGFIDTKDEAVMARINKSVGGSDDE